MSNRIRVLPLLVASLPLTALAGETKNDTTELEAIEVTGQRRYSLNDGYTAASYTSLGLPMTLRETPQSVSVVTAKQIEDENTQSVVEALQRVPGLNLIQRGTSTSGYSTLYARGNPVDNYLLDGSPISSGSFGGQSSQGWADSEVDIYERIEVLKGGSALLGGTGYPSAQVNLVRKRPQAERQGSIHLSGGSWKQFGIGAEITGALNEAKTLRGLLIANHRRADAQQERTKSNRQSFYAALEADVGEKTTVGVGVDWQRNHERGAGVQGFIVHDTEGYPTLFDEKSNRAADWSFAKSQRSNFFVNLRHRFNQDWSAKIDYNYTKSSWKQFQGVVGGGRIDHVTGEDDATYARTDAKPIQHSFSADLNGSFELGGRRHDILLGGSMYRFRNDAPDYYYDWGDPINAYTFGGRIPKPDEIEPLPSSERIRQHSLYAAARLYPTDSLAVIAGARWNSYRYSFVLDDPYDTSGNNNKAVSSSKFSPYLGIVWDLNDNYAFYASHSQTFRPQTAIDQNKALLAPETGRNTEIGIKGEFMLGRLNTSAALFETQKDNMAVMAGITPDRFYYYEPRKATTRGIELEIGGQIRDGWDIQGGYTFGRTKDDDDDNPVPEIPRHQLKLSTQYRLPGQWNKWQVGAAARWQSSTYQTVSTGRTRALDNPTDQAARNRANAAQKQKAYALLDLNILYRPNQQMELGLYVGNVFNKIYRTAPNIHSYGDGRNVTARFSYRF